MPADWVGTLLTEGCRERQEETVEQEEPPHKRAAFRDMSRRRAWLLLRPDLDGQVRQVGITVVGEMPLLLPPYR